MVKAQCGYGLIYHPVKQLSHNKTPLVQHAATDNINNASVCHCFNPYLISPFETKHYAWETVKKAIFSKKIFNILL